MRVRSLGWSFGLILASCVQRELPAPTPASCELVSELNAEECVKLKAMALPSALAPAYGNAYADNPAATAAGFGIFYDARFSSNNNVRCAHCHAPENSFADRKALAVGIEVVTRNSPTVLDSSRFRWLFWDGRADSAWGQALAPFENVKEMGVTRLEVVQRVFRSHKLPYETAFGPLPPLDDTTRFPARGKPGSPEWETMTPADREAVNRAFVNIGKAIEAFERRVVSGPSPFDGFLAGDESAISAEARQGLIVFFKAGCSNCHSDGMFSDQKFHNLGVADADADSALGRSKGITDLLNFEFNSMSPFFDGPVPADFPPKEQPENLGAFRTPPLRNVSITAPYGHNGQWRTLADAVAFHAKGGGRGEANIVGEVDPKLVAVNLTQEDQTALVAFLKSLTGTFPPPPYDNWPSR